MTTELFSLLEQAVLKGRPVALATVVATRGSCPQRAGARMLIFKDGELKGTVGGGCVEADVVGAAQQLMRKGETALCRFELIADPNEPEGDVCGGVMEILIEPY